MKTTAIRMKLGVTRALAGAALAAASLGALGGCELLVDFDRSKIPTGDLDATIDGPGPLPPDASADGAAPVVDGAADAGASDGAAVDASTDGGPVADGSADGSDASVEVDAAVDATDDAADLDAADATD
jgi:hypothetical protein